MPKNDTKNQQKAQKEERQYIERGTPRKVFVCRAFYVEEEDLSLPAGVKATFFTVRHPGAVVILPVATDGRILMLRQYRPAIGDFVLEVPAGTLTSGEAPLECAQRELQEETGYAASEWQSMGTLFPAPGFCDEVQHCFLARELTPSPLAKDPDEVIEVIPMTLKEVREAIRRNDIRDGKSIALLGKVLLLDLL